MLVNGFTLRPSRDDTQTIRPFLPPLRWPYDRHRGFRTRLRADISANVSSDADQDCVMSAIRMTRRKATHRPRRSMAGRDPARLVPLNPYR
jgi:hypothetical protein